MNRARVVLIGGHRLLLSLLAAKLSQVGQVRVVGVARTASEALRIIPRIKPDLVIADLDAAGAAMLSRGAVAQIGEGGLPIICVSSKLEDVLVTEMLAAGVRGLVDKSDVHETIGQAVEDVLAGGTWFPPEIVARVIIGSAGVQLVR